MSRGAEPRAPGTARTDATVAADRELEDLERELAGLGAAGDAVPSAEWPRLAAAEERLCGLECSRPSAGEHPVLAAASDWCDALERAHEEDAAADAERVVADLHLLGLRVVDERVAAGAAPDPDALFDALLAVEELRQRVAGRGRGAGREPGPGDRAVAAEALETRDSLRARLAALAPPLDAACRERWLDLVIDAADEALLSAGEAPPQVAALRLAEAVDAVRWHARTFAPRRGPGADREGARRLARCAGRLQAEREEQVLTARLQRRFGARAVRAWDRGVLVALLLVIVLLVMLVLGAAPVWTNRLDLALCTFFLWDFGVRATLIRFRPRWLARHVVTDLLPALPWALLLGGPGLGADAARAGWLLRSLRLARMAAPGMRFVRAVGFLARGLDRVVRRNARLLEQEILLFPTVAERNASRAAAATADEGRSFVARARLDELFEVTLRGTAAGARGRLAALRNRALARAAASPAAAAALAAPREPRRATRPLAEDVLRRLARVTASEVEGQVGVEGGRRIARGARLLAGSPLRLLPFVRRWIPEGARSLPDDEVAAGTVRAVTRSLRRTHDRVLWWADLSTTITPAELVGRVGATIVARTARPAVRLLMLGGAYGILYLVAQLLGLGGGAVEEAGAAEPGTFVRLLAALNGLLGPTLLVLGGVCLVLLAIGAWLQRLARDATTFHQQVARAQFLHLTDTFKARARDEDARCLAERVFLPERRLEDEDGAEEAAERDADRFLRHFTAFVSEGISPPARTAGHDAVARAVLLYRDFMDGALFAESDTRATSQLLGNLALRRLIERSHRLGADDLRALARIDLERRRSVLAGPYIWFHSITRALASRAARLIVQFNANAVPLVELERSTPEEVARYEAWLETGEAGADDARPQLTTAFTVLHFLDDAAPRDAEVERRFGKVVAARLQRERRALVRSVLGCWPLSSRPLEQRVLNLRAAYDNWIGGGRVLLLPLRFALGAARLALVGCSRLVEAIESIRRPDRALAARRPRQEDFATALRKVDRMRLPAAWQALRLRARFDPEYLGLALPGLPAPGTGPAPIDRDVEFLRASAALEDEVARVRVRAGRDLALLERLCDDGLTERLAERLGLPGADLDPARRRALALAFHADLEGARCAVAGDLVIVEAGREATRRGLAPGRWPRLRLRRTFEHWWRERGRELVGAAHDPGTDGAADSAARADGDELVACKRSAWAAVTRDVDGARSALLTVAAGPRAAREAGEAALAAALRHPGQVTEELTTLRTIQATTLLDVRNYRRHAFDLGGYADDERMEDWAPWLTP